jgi:glycosyltransferase involved in cell wall biosynthesis
MNRIGLYLGFPPEGGGAFQYAQSVLAAVAALPNNDYEIVVAHAHPAWSKILDGYNPKINSLAVREGRLEPAIRFALRQGFPIVLWRWIAPNIHALTRRLLRQNCDLWIFPAQDVLTYALPTGTIGAIHDLMHRHEKHFPEVSGWGLFGRRERHYQNLCAYARAILVDSEIGKSHVTDAYMIASKHVHVLPYVAPNYINQEVTPADFDSRYTLPPKFAFYPAQFWEHKNHIRLINALAKAHESVPDLHLVLAGSKKNAYAKIIETINDLNLKEKVHVLGYIPDQDMSTFYRRARALVMPTFFGPTNIPPLEAMAVGCPMALSNIYAMPEQVGSAALLFDPMSVSAIADAMVRLATDDALCARLSEAGRTRANEWGQPQFSTRLREIIQSMLLP